MCLLALAVSGDLIKSGFTFGFQGLLDLEGASYLQKQINRAAVIYIFTDLAEVPPRSQTEELQL